MKRLHVLGLALVLLSLAVLVASIQAGAAKPQANKVKQTAKPVWTLAMDWPRIAYASGKEGNSETIHVWNVVTGATSVVKSKGDFAQHHTAQIAIAGKRLAWVRTAQFGNTELDHWLYTAQVGGWAHLLRRAFGSAYTGGSSCGPGGPQIGGVVGDGDHLAVSTWTGTNEGSGAVNQRLSLITPKRLRTIASGPDAIVSESEDGGRLAVLPLPMPSYPAPDYCDPTPPTSVAVYSTDGTLLKTIALGPPDPSTFTIEVALSGNRLVVLTGGLPPSGPATVRLDVYDWRTAALAHTWPVAIHQYPGEVNLSVHGKLAAVEGPFRLHLVDLNTGKDVTIAPASHTVCPTAIGPRGLVYAVNPHNTGKLVFVPMAKLLAAVS